MLTRINRGTLKRLVICLVAAVICATILNNGVAGAIFGLGWFLWSQLNTQDHRLVDSIVKVVENQQILAEAMTNYTKKLDREVEMLHGRQYDLEERAFALEQRTTLLERTREQRSYH